MKHRIICSAMIVAGTGIMVALGLPWQIPLFVFGCMLVFAGVCLYD